MTGRARHVLVTGAGHGLGRALALAFACNGATIGIHFGHDAAAANETAAMVRNAGAHAYVAQADLAADDSAVALAAAVHATQMPLDVLVLNAGVAGVARLVKITEALWDQVIAVSYRSHVRLVGLLDDCIAPHGHIVAIASLMGMRGAEGLAAYAAAKGALLGYVRDAAVRFGPRGIHVNAVVPGLMHTAMMDVVTDDQYAALVAENTLGRANTLDEIARVVTFITSLDGVSGQTFSLDSRLYPDGRHGSLTGI